MYNRGSPVSFMPVTMPFQTLDLATWPRRDHFRLFQAMDFPYFSISLEVDVTAWRRALKAAGVPFFQAMVYEVTAVANGLENFRTRIRGAEVVLHDRVHPSFTVPWRGELFNFCTVDFAPGREAFLAQCKGAIAHAEAADRLLLDEPQRDDMLFLSCVPWFAFTGVTHAVDARSQDSIPRISWGRLIEREGRSILPMNFQLHHGLADGLHVAKFMAAFEASLQAQS